MKKPTRKQVRALVAGLVISVGGIIGIAQYEGFRSNAYDDGVGVQTIGFGTTKGVKKGDTITVTRALMRLSEDVGTYENAMRWCIGNVPLYQYEWDAYVSLVYNIGTGAFCRSTLVKKLHRQPPDYKEACKQILRWNRAGGRILRGLVKRRQKEYRQCMGES